jgi:hypothetical protein
VCAREGIEAILIDDDLTAVIAELPSDLAPWGA